MSSADGELLPDVPIDSIDAPKTEAEIYMKQDFADENEMGKFETSLADIVSEAGSLEELESRLNSLESIDYARLENHVIKTFPPRREFIVGVKRKGGDIKEKTLTVAVLPDDRLAFHKIR